MGRPTIFSPEENALRCKARQRAWRKNNMAHIREYDRNKYLAKRKLVPAPKSVTITGNTLTHLCI